MLLKSKIYTFLSFLVICLECSYAAPITHPPVTNGVAKFELLGGTLKFTQIDSENIKMTGQFTKGLTDPNPANYGFAIGPIPLPSFPITIDLPGTAPFTTTFPGNLTIPVARHINVLFKNNNVVMDRAEIDE
ncbi:7623_t:CDS:1, partial [Ambispora leptoticha]